MGKATLNKSSDVTSDVIIIGAGMAGATLAAVLGQKGVKVILLDPYPSCQPVFRAEKIEREQVVLLRKLDLLKYLLPHCGTVEEVHGAYDGRIFKSSRIEQYGSKYADMVNALRSNMPPAVDQRLGRVESIVNNGQVQGVKLAGGEELTSHLVVLASGVTAAIQASLGMRRRVLKMDQSMGFGFDVAPSGSEQFPFDALTYYCFNASTQIDYLTLFKFRNVMRANLFAFRSARDPWVREFMQEPGRMLRRYLPKLSRVSGEYRVISDVDFGRVDLYTLECEQQPGIVMIGDAMQNACPATGMGLDKVLTDVDVLSECIPAWLATGSMSADKLSDFYKHPRKVALDSRALKRARDHRNLVVGQSLRWRIHRSLLHTKWRMLGSFGKPGSVGLEASRSAALTKL